MYMYIYVYMYIYIYVYMYIHVYVYVYVYISVSVCMCVCVVFALIKHNAPSMESSRVCLIVCAWMRVCAFMPVYVCV